MRRVGKAPKGVFVRGTSAFGFAMYIEKALPFQKGEAIDARRGSANKAVQLGTNPRVGAFPDHVAYRAFLEHGLPGSGIAGHRWRNQRDGKQSEDGKTHADGFQIGSG